ncbi:MAG: APC family permease [Acidobacteria bacterium]|nr:APC family permease [Acidobacteriota bacterium]
MPENLDSPTVTQKETEPAAAGEGGVVHSDLHTGALGLTAVLMQGITHTAPATAVLLTLPFTARDAGVTAPLAYLIAFLIVLMLGVVLTQLARHLPSAGGYYTYVSRTIHPRVGFLTSWLYFLYTPMASAFCLAMMGAILERSLKAELGIFFPWWAFLLLGTAFILWLAYQGINVSAVALVVLGSVEMGIVLLLAAWGLFFSGPGGINFSSFNPANAPSGNGLYLGIIFSIFALTGWEGVVPLAEESQHPRRIIPRAIFGVILIMGFYLVFTAWGILIGWGTGSIQSFITSEEVPAFGLARRFWGAGWLVVLLALLNSMLGASLATTLVSTRMWYSMGRSGSLPAAMAVVHPRHKTPVNAVYFQTLVTLVVGLGLGFWVGPEQEFYLMGTILTLALVPIYSAGNLGTFLLYFRERREEFRPWLHAFLPGIATVAVVWVGYKSVVPLPPPPITYAPWIVGGWFLIGVAVLIFMKLAGREQWLRLAGGVAEADVLPRGDQASRPSAAGVARK